MVVQRDKSVISLNRPQAEIQLVKANKTYFIAARGTGKTSYGIAPYLIDCVMEMPGTTGIMVANSFEQMWNRTLPPVVASWAEMGFREWDPEHGGHYIIGKNPPPDFARPYIPVLKPDKYIHWYNGTVIALISLAVKGAANALSVQFGTFDELKLMDEEDVKEILKVFRPSVTLKRLYGHKSQFLSTFYSTDKWADLGKIQWILDKKKLMDTRKVEVVKALAVEYAELLAQRKDGIEDDALESKIDLVEKMLNKLRRNLVFYCESSAEENKEVLGQKYFDDQQRDLSTNEYNVAILNKNPTVTQGVFYPDLSDIHFYDQPDYYSHLPLILATDYQHSIAPVVIAQLSKVMLDVDSLNYIDSLFTLEPAKLTDAIELFCSRYKSHENRGVYYVYDHTAIGKKAVGKSDSEVVIDILKHNKFNPISVYTGQAPSHFTKYNNIASFLKNKPGTRYQTFINRAKNPDMIQSMNLSEVTMKNGITQKVKKYENTLKYPNFPQQWATHFSDVFDMIQWAVNELGMINPGGSGFGAAFR